MFSLPLLLTNPHPCNYLPDRDAQTVFVYPEYPMNNDIYAQLLTKGFRRSGDEVYRPQCQNCTACISVRIPIHTFEPNRNQKRCIKKNQLTRAEIKSATFEQSHYDLYVKYQHYKHPGGTMGDCSPEDYLRFLGSQWCHSHFIEFSLAGDLIAVAIVDYFNDALSAVYTFFDPKFNAYSPGVYAVLWQIAQARELKLDWLYLGYWIETCKKMSYKNQYQPLQLFNKGRWQNYIP